MNMNVRAHVHVSGLVQGVFFRAHTKDLAVKLGVKGWVRNLPDGRVEAIFEGEENAVREMIKFCKQGPPGAKVSDVNIKWEEPKNEFHSFEIRY
ncbi:MAG: acylphosphatase [Candidatus Aenigmatarchaeota archaeon]|nr:MAG: acylphosphatase [Candidatus Aenigmarchaeota archaeon]